LWAWLAVAGLICGGVLLFVYAHAQGGLSGRRARPRVAVLPFRGSVPDSENDLYGHALADSIVASLAANRDISVTTPVEPESGGKTTLLSDADLAAKLKVDYLITGRFDKNGAQSRVIARLEQSSDGGVIWTRSYSFSWSNLVRVEGEIGADLAGRSAGLPTERNRAAGHAQPLSPEAQEEFLAGHYAVVEAKKTLRLESISNALLHLNRAIELDPTYADAHADLASVLVYRAVPYQEGNSRFVSEAESHASAALERAPRNAIALASLAKCAIIRRNLKAAVDLANQAVTAEPRNVEALSSLAEVYGAIGFDESALVCCERCLHRSFVNIEPFIFGSIYATSLRQFDKAQKFMDAHAAVDPDSPYVPTFRGNLLLKQGDYISAEAAFREVWQVFALRNISPDLRRLYSYADFGLALAQAGQGKVELARDAVQHLGPPLARRANYDILVRVAAGDYSSALTAIGVSFHQRNYRFLVTTPELKPLYDQPRFRAILTATYPEWFAMVKEFGDSAPVRPPSLPAPADFLRAHGIRDP
jgi:TolB-like protein